MACEGGQEGVKGQLIVANEGCTWSRVLLGALNGVVGVGTWGRAWGGGGGGGEGVHRAATHSCKAAAS